MHSVAGLPAAVRSGLLRAVRLLVGLAHRVRPFGIVAVRVAVHGGAGSVGPPWRRLSGDAAAVQL
jgi:hypothetical protein